jgi:DNA-binding IscR family transcriptional regulator
MQIDEQAGRRYGSLLHMAQNGQFGLSVRVLGFLALAPDNMHTSAAIAESLHTSPVMVRRVFSALHKAGFIVQRKGPQGGAKLKIAAKSIGLGDVFAVSAGNWPITGEKTVDAILKRTRDDAVSAMNETSLASLAKKLKKGVAKVETPKE